MVILTRLLQLASACLFMFGLTAMLTTAGIQPPNAIVFLGLAGIVLMAIASARLQRDRFSGWWWTLVAIALPLVVLTWPSAGIPCPADHPPLTNAFTCDVTRPREWFAAGGLGLLIATIGALRELDGWHTATRSAVVSRGAEQR